MIQVLDVCTTREGGSEIVARTTLALDGGVTMAVQPRILADRALVQRHVDEVRARVEGLRRRHRRIDQAATVLRRGSEVGIALGSVGSVVELLQDAARMAAWWLAGAVLFGLLRWLGPRLLRRLGRWWVDRLTRTR